MLGFFVKHKKVRGVITIFLTLIYLVTYLTIGVFVDGGRIKMAQTVIEDVQQIATENVMSQYHRGLYEYYGLFGISNYETDQIAKDVQAQIEESVGLKVPEDTVKSFMEDVITVGSSGYSNYGTLTSGESVTDNVSEYINQIIDDLNDSHKRFDPYGVKVDDVKASYIDLSNEEALRAQIRDEMRYTAPLILGANFFGCINQLISLGDATKAVSDVADTIESTTDKIETKREEYKDSLDDLTKTFKKFVESTYKKKGKWGKINSIMELFASLFSGGNNENEDDDYKTDMHRDKEGGYSDLLQGGKDSNILIEYCTSFDSSSWTYGDEIDPIYSVDEDGHRYISGYEYESRSIAKHRGDIATDADEYEKIYKGKFEAIKKNVEEIKSLIEISIEKAKATLDAIGVAESSFKTGAEKSKGKKSKKIYLDNMEQYLRVWNDIANQRNDLLIMKDKAEKLINILEQLKKNVENVCREIKGESPYQGFEPSHKLLSKCKDTIKQFHDVMVDLDDKTNVIKSFQNTADSESVQNDVLQLINSVLSEKEKEENGIVDNNTNALFGDIIGHEKSENALYDPAKADEEKSSESVNYEAKKFTKKNIISKVKDIMNKAGEIIAGLPKEIFDNIYDEAYILSHCRDYVHTYRYKKNHYHELGSEELANRDIDTVLNTKFIKDQSATNYLSDAEFDNIQVTPAEIEYIICGIKEHDPIVNNVTKMYTNIFILRLALNYIAVLTSPNSLRQVSELAAGATVFAPVVYVAAPLIYALPQSIKETKEIMYDCKKVSLWNGSADLQLYSAFAEMGENVAKEAYEKIKEKAQTIAINVGENIGTVAMIEAVKTHHPPGNIVSAYTYILDNLDLLELNNTSSNGGVVKDKFDDGKIKAGYSDYLLIYLFLGGIGPLKKTQINRLQDVIQTNMKKVDDKFELRTTFSQIGVETKSSIKFIFMTQSFMRKTFKNANRYDKYSISVKTSYAY